MKSLQRGQQEIAGQAAHCGDGAGQRHLDHRCALGPGGLAQHHQIANVVRHFMGQDGQRGDDAQAHVRQKSRSDQHPVAKGMDTVARQHRPAAAFGGP